MLDNYPQISKFFGILSSCVILTLNF